MKKYKNNDLVTLKVMMIIFIVSFISCILIEFFSDNFNKCSAFLEHKGFFENILLGILGSAIITYFTSYLLFKQSKKQKEDIIKQCLEEVGKKYWDMFLINDISIDEYKIRSHKLQEVVSKLIKCCDESYIYNRDLKKLIEVCKSTLIPLCIEVKTFSEILEIEQSRFNMKNEELKEIYDIFKEYLNEKLELEKLNQRFYKSSMIYGEIMEQIEKDKKEFWEVSERIKLEIQYRDMIGKYISKKKL